MSLMTVTMVAAVVVVLGASSTFHYTSAVEMSSDYAKVAKNEKRRVAENVRESTSEALKGSTEDYEDFDDVEEKGSLSQSPSADTAMKYFKGIASLLALMYKFGGRFGKLEPEKVEIKEEPREEIKITGKRFGEAQDRFEFPQKKFKYQDTINPSAVDQKFQPVENYPPYNPLAANTVDTYDDKKTSYDSDLWHYDSSKNSLGDYNADVEIQHSHSYDFALQTPRPVNHPSHGDWANKIRPVYQPWTPETQKSEVPENPHQSWKTQYSKDSADKPWKPEMSTGNPETDSGLRQPWKDELSTHDFPIYHHDFQGLSPDDHQLEHHSSDEDRVSKKPYSYYFLGRKLWYVPLLFSVYFIIYIGALVLKSVARHKIQFPDKIWNLHEDQFGHGNRRRHRRLDQATEKYEKALENINNKFM